jgi:hypothetical protein
MSDNRDDVVRVAAGDMVTMELYRQDLVEAGIQARVVGEELEAGIGTAVPNSVELWVRASEAEQAKKIIEQIEKHRGQPEREARHFPHPESDPKPKRRAEQGPHGHYHKEPGTS